MRGIGREKVTARCFVWLCFCGPLALASFVLTPHPECDFKCWHLPNLLTSSALAFGPLICLSFLLRVSRSFERTNAMLALSITALMANVAIAPIGLIQLHRWVVHVENFGLPTGWWFTAI